jgi:tetratricopeptide (TPR) repeat protein
MLRRLAVVGLTGAMLALSTGARADGTSEADQLFNLGRELLEKGQFAEACPKFVKSEELSPAVGTLLNLGYCWEQVGRIRSALDAYAEAEVLAGKANDPKKASFARERFKEIEPKAIRVVIRIVPPAAPGLEVHRNGVLVPKADWGQPIAVDPDEVVVSATAPHAAPWKSVVMAKGTGAVVTVFVPPLGDGTATTPSSGSGSGIGWRRVGALGLGGTGLLAIGGGIALGLAAKSRYDDTLDRCDAAGCDESALASQRGAVAQGNIATGLVALGVVLAGAGVYLWLTGEPSSSPRAVGATF